MGDEAFPFSHPSGVNTPSLTAPAIGEYVIVVAAVSGPTPRCTRTIMSGFLPCRCGGPKRRVWRNTSAYVAASSTAS